MPFRPVYIALGSNWGDPQKRLLQAVEALNECAALRNCSVSSLRWTEPLGPVEQPAFLNGVLAAESNWEPECLLALLHCVEHQLGRDRRHEVHWGPRPIDLDLLMVGDLTRNTPTLRLPHPEMTRRSFVLDPLHELAPGAIHPSTGQTVACLRGALCK